MIGSALASGVVVDLIITAIIALFVYVGCRLAGKPDWAVMGAAVVILIGAALTLAAAL